MTTSISPYIVDLLLQIRVHSFSTTCLFTHDAFPSAFLFNKTYLKFHLQKETRVSDPFSLGSPMLSSSSAFPVSDWHFLLLHLLQIGSLFVECLQLFKFFLGQHHDNSYQISFKNVLQESNLLQRPEESSSTVPAIFSEQIGGAYLVLKSGYWRSLDCLWTYYKTHTFQKLASTAEHRFKATSIRSVMRVRVLYSSLSMSTKCHWLMKNYVIW